MEVLEMERIYRNAENRTIDLNKCFVDDGNAFVDGPHGAGYVTCGIYEDASKDNPLGMARWTTLKTDINVEADLSDACDWTCPDMLVINTSVYRPLITR
jgi:hypothetical protein